jgi:hypothetical protein
MGVLFSAPSAKPQRSLRFRVSPPEGTSPFPYAYLHPEDAMKAHFNNLPMKTWLLLVVSALAIAYPIARVLVPAVVRAVVPEVVRNVLSVI